MNGIEASRALKKLMPTTPLVMFTTFADSYLTKEALTTGVDAVVPKSDGATTLIRSIQSLFVVKSPPPASAARQQKSSHRGVIRSNVAIVLGRLLAWHSSPCHCYADLCPRLSGVDLRRSGTAEQRIRWLPD